MVIDALGPVFLLILAGVVLNRLNFPGAAFWPGIERLTYYLLFPALLVHRLALAEFSMASLGSLAAVIALGLIGVSLLVIGIRRWLAMDEVSLTSVYQGAVRFNTYIGLAGAEALFGPPGLALAAIALGLMIPMVNIGSVLAFSLVDDASRVQWKALVRGLASNPLILACLLGLVLNGAGVGLPGWSSSTLRLLGAAALPLGLLAVGVALNPQAARQDVSCILKASVLKFIVMPALLWGLALVFGLSLLHQHVLVLLGCLPTASSAYILARQLGGNASLMANIITAQSLLAFIVMPIWLVLVLESSPV